jgi:hypothetical protein
MAAQSTGGDHVDFAPRPLVPRGTAVAEPDVVEHRFLRGGLRLFIAGEHRQNDRLLRQSMGVAGVERCVEVNQEVKLAERFGRKGRIGIRAIQITA